MFDATWQYAKNMMTANRDRLGGVIQVQFRGETPVYREYTIRRQPKAACMSTLEAIAAALDVLEDNNVASTVRGALSFARVLTVRVGADNAAATKGDGAAAADAHPVQR